jgi:hypothetical protein
MLKTNKEKYAQLVEMVKDISTDEQKEIRNQKGEQILLFISENSEGLSGVSWEDFKPEVEHIFSMSIEDLQESILSKTVSEEALPLLVARFLAKSGHLEVKPFTQGFRWIANNYSSLAEYGYSTTCA